eukprot:maker-scaffold_1-snap-gene-12.36-mRNA-1 protein AED:0.00 eAED:0.00 QI:46/1/1/1/1/1/2/21/212
MQLNLNEKQEMKIDIVLLFACVEFALILAFCIPFSSQTLNTIQSFRPWFWLFLFVCVTSLVPLYEGVSTIFNYKPTTGLTEATDPSYLNATVNCYRSGLICVLYLILVIIQNFAISLAESKDKLRKSELNRLAIQKQAEAASQQSISLLEKVNNLEESVDEEGKKKIQSRIEELELKVKVTTENYVKALDECALLEKKLSDLGNIKENKKDK